MGRLDANRAKHCPRCGAGPSYLAASGGICLTCYPDKAETMARHKPSMSVSVPLQQVLLNIKASRAAADLAAAKEKPANHRARWTTDQDLQLVVEFSKGMAASQLAKEMKRTKFAVIGRLHTLGLLSFDKDTMTYFTKPQHYYTIKKAPTL